MSQDQRNNVQRKNTYCHRFYGIIILLIPLLLTVLLKYFETNERKTYLCYGTKYIFKLALWIDILTLLHMHKKLCTIGEFSF